MSYTCTERKIRMTPPSSIAPPFLALVLLPGERTIVTQVRMCHDLLRDPSVALHELGPMPFRMNGDGLRHLFGELAREQDTFFMGGGRRLVARNGACTPVKVVFGLDENGFLLYEVADR